MSDINKQRTGSTNPIRSRISLNNHGTSTTSTGSASNTEDKTATGNISALKAVRSFSANNVTTAQPNLTEPEATIIGIATTSANSGNTVTIQKSGKLEDSSFTFSPGTPIYLDINGCLTASDPFSLGHDFRTQIATALGPGAIEIKIQEPIQDC